MLNILKDLSGYDMVQALEGSQNGSCEDSLEVTVKIQGRDNSGLKQGRSCREGEK